MCDTSPVRFCAYIAVSVDGYVASSDGGVAWLDSFQAESYGYDDFMQQIDAVVIGRTTFDQAMGFGELPYKGKSTFVLASRPIESPPPQTTAWQDGGAKLIAHLRGMSLQRDVWLFAGPKCNHAFRELGAVDTYELYVMPVLLGDGIPLFGCSNAKTLLRLTDNHVFSDGVVKLVYEPV